MPTLLPKISPCLWFDSHAEPAANLYVSIFPDSRITQITRYGPAGQELHHQPPGSVMTVSFQLAHHPFTALNGGPHFKFTEALSLQVFCEDQQEIDHYWTKLSEGGDPNAQQCGWLKDRFGLSWQIVPRILPDLLKDYGSQRAHRTMTALLQMKKLDLAALQRAHAGT